MTDWRQSLDFVDRDEMITTENCTREPLHLTTCVQPGAALLATAEERIVAASDSIASRLGVAADQLIDQQVGPVLGRVGLQLDALPEEQTVSTALGETRRHRSPGGPEIIEFYDPDGNPALSPSDTVMVATRELRGTRTVDAATQMAIGVLARLCGYDRVWAYRFHDDGHGEVIAETKRSDLPAFLGLHYPASDIPEVARRLFLESPLRLIGDVNGVPVPLIESDRLQAPLDVSNALVRGVSPIHVAYLRGMGVTASLSLALVVNGRLWGLLSAHHYSGPKWPSGAALQACEALASIVAMHLDGVERATESDRRLTLMSHAGRVSATVSGSDSILDGLVAAGDDLLAMTESSGAIVRVAGRVRRIGSTPDGESAVDLLEALDRAIEPDNLDPMVVESTTELPATVDQPEVAAGLLALPLARDPGNWIVWLRPEFVRTVAWGDNSRGVAENHRPLSPEDSFRRWTETVAGRCRPWEDAVVETATSLRAMLGIHVLRQAEMMARSVTALQTANRELDRFAYVAAHDLSEPLRGIANYVDAINEDGGDALPVAVRPHLDAVSDLAERMAGLVESLLTYASVGRQQLRLETLQLSDLVAEAAWMVQRRLSDAAADVRTIGDVELTGDRIQLVQVLANLISNASKYRGEAAPVIEIEPVGLDETADGRARWPHHGVDLPPPVVVAVRDNGIGVPAEHSEAIFEVFRRLHTGDGHPDGSGAGLTIARRIAERHGGNLWHEPNRPSGSIFYLAIADPAAHLSVKFDD